MQIKNYLLWRPLIGNKAERCISCEEIQFLSTPMLKIGQAKLCQGLQLLCATLENAFFNRFDLGTRIGYLSCTLTFYNCFHKYQLDEAGTAG